MRHTVVVRGSNKIKRGELTYFINTLQDGDCIRLSQKDKHIYLVYRISQDMSQKQIQVNQQILFLNGLTSDTTSTIQQFHPRKVEHLKVIVSQLDWKIISLNQMKIAQSFLEQISVVWQGAKIPIYYDQNNYVVLNAQCENVGRLSINTTVEFIEEKENQRKQSEESESQQRYQQKLTLSNEMLPIDMGYLNRIHISNSLRDKLKIQGHFWIVENLLQFEQLPTINELLNFEKKQQKDSKNLISMKKLVLLERKETKSQSSYQCSKQSRALLGLSQAISISDKEEYKPNIQNLSLQIFLNDNNFTIKIQKLPKDLQNESQLVKGRMEEAFAHHILNILFNRKQFFVLEQEYPYYFSQQFYIITLAHKTDIKVKDKFYRLAFIGKQTVQKRQEYLKKLMDNKIVFITHSNTSPQPLLLYQRYQLISKWIKIIHQHKNSINILNTSNQQKLQHIFEVIYKQEINKTSQFIRNSQNPQNICVVASYGSNGKTFLHYYLKRRQIRMWKVNFRQLNNPSLTFKEIDFYLQWIFANTPYEVIFFDDFDSLCSKIDDGDQLKKRQKTISKLFIRKMNQYMKVYKRKLIITAKSDSNLDEQLPNHITITLKNPNRQLRLNTFTSVLKNKNDREQSPIKKFRFEQEDKQINRQDKYSKEIQELVSVTESMTFGAFAKHAIAFTKPKSQNSTQIYDFTKIAGLKQAKHIIKNIIQKPIKYSFLFKSAPIKLPRGILLYGGTGNGKSALGLAVQDEFKMKYFSVKGSDILSKYIGGSEAAVRDIFEKALSVSPSIIFFDQFQSIVPKRSSNNTGVNDRIVNQFLCYLDGVSAISGVYIIAASSRPDLIDPAVLRPGRLDAHLFIDYPQPQERKEIIEMFQRSIRIDVGEEYIVEKTMHFSYSDMIGLFKELRIKRSAQVLKMEAFTSEDFIKISKELFDQTIAKFKLSVNAEQQKRQKKIYENFRDGVGPDIKSQKQVQF